MICGILFGKCTLDGLKKELSIVMNERDNLKKAIEVFIKSLNI